MLDKRSKSNKMQKNRKVSKKVNQRKKTKKVGKMKGGARSAYEHINSNNELPEPGDNNNENYDMFEPIKEEKKRTEHRFSGLKSFQNKARGLNVETNTNVNLLPGRRGSKKQGRLSNTLFIRREIPTNYARHAKRVGVKKHGSYFRKSSSNNNSNIEV